MCGKFCRIQKHQHRVGTHAPSLCARRSLVDAIFLASAQLLISTGAGMKESSLLITELTNLILAMRKRGTSPNPRQKSWILLRQAMSFTLLLATKTSLFWASIAMLITSLTLNYSELARRNNPSPEHCNEWMIPSSNLVFWVDFEELIHKSKDFRFVDLSPLPPKVPMCLKTKPTLGEIQGKNRKWMESIIAYSMVVSYVYLFVLIYVHVYSYITCLICILHIPPELHPTAKVHWCCIRKTACLKWRSHRLPIEGPKNTGDFSFQ